MGSVTLIRSAALRGFRATVRELGGDAEEYASAVGLPADALHTDDVLIPVRTMVAVLHHAAAQLDCADIGLQVAARQDLGLLGPLALAMQSCSTVHEALTCANRYVFLHCPAITLSIEPDPNHAHGMAAVRYDTSANAGVHDHGTDLGLAVLHRTMLDLVGGKYGLRSVDLPYLPPAPLSVYEAFFQATVHVERPAARLRVPQSVLRQPVKGGGNAQLRQLAEAFLDERLASDNPRRVGPSVRAAIEQSLGTAPFDIVTVSELLAIHPRTLQRRLSEESTSFATLVDDVRKHAARRYLIGTDMPMAQVAGLLGLSEQSALSRCCRRWWGASPTELRRNRAVPADRDE